MREWIVTFFGAGKSPVAPGTAGSLLACIVVLGLHALCIRVFPESPVAFQYALLAGLAIASAASVWLGPWAIAHYGRKDPGSFVLDEVAGIFLTMLHLPQRSGMTQLWVVVIAFGAFRLFDVLKPPPCGALEKLPAGWGILADDLMAALYANVLAQLLIRYVFHL